MNEQCWILLGGVQENLWWGRLAKHIVGQPFSVGFNYDWVLNREETKGDVVGFLHTHPGFTSHYSSRDDRTMRAWVYSFGRPLVCCIYGVDGYSAWWYMDDESDPVLGRSIKRIAHFLVGVTDTREVREYSEKELKELDEEEENITCNHK